MYFLEQFSSAELTFAAFKSPEFTGQRNASRIIKENVSCLPKRVTAIKKIIHSGPTKPTKYTTEEFLALIVDARLTKKSYILMQAKR